MADALLGGIVINEVLPDPNSALGSSGPRFDTDGSGTVTPTDEYIEILNTSGAAINIGGLQLWDKTLGNWYSFPAGTVLEPGGHALVMVGAKGGPGPALGPNDMAFYAGRGSAVLNNGPENVILYDPGTNTFVQISYGGAPIVTPGVPGDFSAFPPGATRVGAGEDFGSYTPGVSIQRGPDGSNIYNNGATPTPGTTNICFAGGTLIATPLGVRAVETLRAGDTVLTVKGTVETVIWVGHRTVTPREMALNPTLWPVTIAAGALGPGVHRGICVCRDTTGCGSTAA